MVISFVLINKKECNDDKNPSKFNSENVRTKKDMKNPVSSLTEKIDFIYLL